MGQVPDDDQKNVRLFVPEQATIHEIAQEMRATISSRYGEDVLAAGLARIERLVVGKLERALDILCAAREGSWQFHYTLLWLDESPLSPVLRLCWSQTRFRDLLSLKEDGPFLAEEAAV